MKKYIIFGFVFGIGGGHIYTKNKCELLERKGWKPYLISRGFSEESVIDVNKYKTYSIKELSYLPSFFTKRHVEHVLTKIIEFADITEDDEVFIETNYLRYSYWGELLAKKIGCRHFAYPLEAYFVHNNDDNMDYLKFKLERGEIAGTRKSSLPDLFRNEIIPEEKNVFLSALCTNSLSDSIEDKFDIEYNNYDYKICNIGREEKPYLQYAVRDIVEYAKKHNDKKFLLLLLGAHSTTAEAQKIKTLTDEIQNLNTVFTGRQFPLPQKVIEKMDVCIGSSGCISISLLCHMPTIGYLDNAILPTGVLGVDTDFPIVKEDGNKSLEELLNYVFDNKKEIVSLPIYTDIETYQSTSDERFEKAFMYIVNNNNVYDYYNTGNIIKQGIKGKVINWVSGIPIEIFLRLTGKI